METNMLKEVLLKYKGPLGQLLINLASENSEEVLVELKKFNRKEPCYSTVSMHLESKMNASVKTKVDKKIKVGKTAKVNVRKNDETILRCISEGQNLIIGDSSGHLNICNAKKTFQSIDPNFIKRGFHKIGVATLETPVKVSEIIGDYTFLKIFSVLPGTWNEKWLSQNQVIDFCEEYPDWLAQHGSPTQFLIKRVETELVDESNPASNLAVVRVYVMDEGLLVGLFSLENISSWLESGDNDRVVTPKLLPLAI